MDAKRQISDEEKIKVLELKGKICYIDGELLEDDNIEYHHIKAYKLDGESVISNIAPICKKHHRQIGTMTIQEFRDKNELSIFLITSIFFRTFSGASSLVIDSYASRIW